MDNKPASRMISSNDEEASLGDELAPQLLADLRVVGSLTPEVVSCIANAVRQTTGMLNGPGVSNLVQRCIPDSESAAVAISRLVFNVTPEMKDGILEELSQWRLAYKGRQELMPTELYDNIRRNLDSLIQDERASRLLHKSRRLQRDTGNELYAVKCICDVRPVFDDEHSSIEGFVSLINFQLGYQKQNKEYDTLELSLTEDELQYIVDKSIDAIEKLQVLREAMASPEEEEEESL